MISSPLAGAHHQHHGRNASTSAAENRQETASNVQPGLALPANDLTDHKL
jgi:hypothetical protein